MAEIWVTVGATEYDDILDPLVWDNEPTDAEVEAVYLEMYPEICEEVSVVHQTTKVEIRHAAVRSTPPSVEVEEEDHSEYFEGIRRSILGY